eukprot:m51a1_g10870 hypothetical protein (110) ;mRNA; r:28980-39293
MAQCWLYMAEHVNEMEVSHKKNKFYNGKYKVHVVKIQVVINNQGIPMDVGGLYKGSYKGAIDISRPSKKQDKFYNGKYKGHVVKIQMVVNNQGIPMDVQGFLLPNFDLK